MPLRFVRTEPLEIFAAPPRMTRSTRSPSFRDRKRRTSAAQSSLVRGTCAIAALSLLLLTHLPKNISLFPSSTGSLSRAPAPRALLTDPALTFPSQILRPAPAKPITVLSRTIAGTPLYIITIDLADPETFISVGLANRANQANSNRSTKGDENFAALVRRHRAAITTSGTFFSMDAQKRVMGNLVSGGQFLKYSPSENYGTTLGIRSGNQLEMTTARIDGTPKWREHWFSLTAGPRLLRSGTVAINPRKEGFRDPAVMGSAVRSAIGFTPNRKLLHVTFLTPVSLVREAHIMQALGCHEAMNLDGGTSLALAKGGRILRRANRNLTNVITVYDVQHPAPSKLRLSWETFQTIDDRMAISP